MIPEVILDLKAQNKEEAIDELAQALFDSGKIHDKKHFVKDIMIREKILSTYSKTCSIVAYPTFSRHAIFSSRNSIIFGISSQVRSRGGVYFTMVSTPQACAILGKTRRPERQKT